MPVAPQQQRRRREQQRRQRRRKQKKKCLRVGLFRVCVQKGKKKSSFKDFLSFHPFFLLLTFMTAGKQPRAARVTQREPLPALVSLPLTRSVELRRYLRIIFASFVRLKRTFFPPAFPPTARKKTLSLILGSLLRRVKCCKRSREWKNCGMTNDASSMPAGQQGRSMICYDRATGNNTCCAGASNKQQTCPTYANGQTHFGAKYGDFFSTPFLVSNTGFMV